MRWRENTGGLEMSDWEKKPCNGARVEVVRCTQRQEQDLILQNATKVDARLTDKTSENKGGRILIENARQGTLKGHCTYFQRK